MSREIKFKAWLKKQKKMVEVHKIDFQDRVITHYLDDLPFPTLIKCSFDDVELMQYTGLKDKNGKEIYDGDIMKVTPPIWAKEGIFKVIYDNGRFIITDNKVWQNIGTLVEYSEVIGNIYDNPELLEVE